MLQSDVAKGKIIAPSPDEAGDVVAIRAEITLTTAQIDAGIIIEMLPLPAGCVPVDFILDSDDLDSGSAAITLDVGLMSGDFGDPDVANARTIGAEIFSGSIAAQAGTVVRPTLKTAFRIAASDVDRGIGVKIVVDAATAVSGKVGLTMLYRG